MIKLKRAYERAERGDGYRVLVDRLWPRGVKKEKLPLDEWAKELSPTAELRKSFGHDPAKWNEFRMRYQLELRAPLARKRIEALAQRALTSNVTLVYSARDEDHNNAVVLKRVLEQRALRKAA